MEATDERIPRSPQSPPSILDEQQLAKQYRAQKLARKQLRLAGTSDYGIAITVDEGDDFSSVGESTPLCPDSDDSAFSFGSLYIATPQDSPSRRSMAALGKYGIADVRSEDHVVVHISDEDAQGLQYGSDEDLMLEQEVCFTPKANEPPPPEGPSFRSFFCHAFPFCSS